MKMQFSYRSDEDEALNRERECRARCSTENDQTDRNYWQHIIDLFHQFLKEPSIRSMGYLK